MEPEYPVQPIESYESPSGPAEEEPAIILVKEETPVSGSVPVIQENTKAEAAAPQAEEETLPPVIGEDPTFTPPPTSPPTDAPAETTKPSKTPPPNPKDFQLDKFQVFSRFFPSRHLNLFADPEARAPRAGVKIWPEEPGKSLLERMLNNAGE